MYCDFHTHTFFSGDSEAKPESQIEQAVNLGMKRICITDHLDMDYPPEYEFSYEFDYDEYFNYMSGLREKFAGKIDVLIGVELGLQPHLKKELREYVENHSFDFIIGSTHLIDGIDPFYPEMFAGLSEHEAVLKYFNEVLLNIKTFHNFDVTGHIDYIVRYTPSRGRLYNWLDYRDIIDEILKYILDNGLGIECNTSRLGNDWLHCNPHEDIIKRYRELGGEIITLGADAHSPKGIGRCFSEAGEILRNAGFKYYTVFKNRKPEFLPL